MAGASDCFTELDQRRLELNAQLKGAGIRLSIVARGTALNLRGVLPPKPGKDKRAQAHIPLGLDYTDAGLSQAYNEALKVGAQLREGLFDWANHVEIKSYESCSAWIGKYRRHWLSLREDTPDYRERFEQREWKPSLRWLPPDENLTPEILKQTAQLKEPNSRSRQLLVQGLNRLAQFAKIDVDLAPYQGKYSSKGPTKRNIPTDEQILEDRVQYLQSPKWALVFDRMVIYGLRNHECWNCEVSSESPYLCKVLGGKTEARDGILPLYQEWAVEWRPWEGELPTVNTEGMALPKARKLYGERTARQFKRMGIASDRTPYDYRHAYALRAALVFDFDVAARARMMGHSATVHLNIYNQYIDEKRLIELHKAKMLAGTLPKPPKALFRE